MPDFTQCPKCKTRYKTSGMKLGKRIRCLRCRTVITISGEMLNAKTMVAPNTEDHPSSGVDSHPKYFDDCADLPPGSTLGRCVIEKELGHGGMGAVYLAHHSMLQIQVAVKVLPKDIATRNNIYIKRFLREARLAAKIDHPNVVQVKDVDKDDASGLYYIILEYVTGGSVRDLLVKEKQLDCKRAIQIVMDITAALEAAAQHSIVHRDIKPDNIMLTDTGQAKLADLGLAKQRQTTDVSLTQAEAIMGTPAYMSQEQVLGAKDVDIRADIYSLGATFFHMLTGEIPHSGETTYEIMMKLAKDPTPDPRELRPDIPASVARLCMKMTAKKKEDRFQTPSELMRELRRVQHLLDDNLALQDEDSPDAHTSKVHSAPRDSRRIRKKKSSRRIRIETPPPAPPRNTWQNIFMQKKAMAGVGGVLFLLLFIGIIISSGNKEQKPVVGKTATTNHTAQTDLPAQINKMQKIIDEKRKQKQAAEMELIKSRSMLKIMHIEYDAALNRQKDAYAELRKARKALAILTNDETQNNDETPDE